MEHLKYMYYGNVNVGYCEWKFLLLGAEIIPMCTSHSFLKITEMEELNFTRNQLEFNGSQC